MPRARKSPCKQGYKLVHHKKSPTRKAYDSCHRTNSAWIQILRGIHNEVKKNGESFKDAIFRAKGPYDEYKTSHKKDATGRRTINSEDIKKTILKGINAAYIPKSKGVTKKKERKSAVKSRSPSRSPSLSS